MSTKKKHGVKNHAHHQQNTQKRMRFLPTGMLFVLVIGTVAMVIYFNQSGQQKGGDGIKPQEQSDALIIQKKTYYEIQSRDHISLGEQHDAYTTNPPTSGPHTEAARGGFHADLADEQAVHNLEHAYVWISYKNLPDNQVQKIIVLAKKYQNRVIASERRANDDDGIVLSAWGRSMILRRYDEKTIEKFIKKNYNTSPERLAS